jgi:transposase InsO family protein
MSLDEKAVLKIFETKKNKAGYRTIKMLFERKFKKRINLKKVRRIKRDFSLITRVRRKNKFRMALIEGQEHKSVQNLVKRNFENPNLLLIDITEMRIMGGQKSYVVAMKNALTREIVGHGVSAKPSVALVTGTVDNFLKRATNSYMIHSDQGVHFTCGDYRNLLREADVIQSMSRKGNCLDNAPIESFFGHMKDEVDYKSCRNVNELRRKLKSYIQYYNYERPQWSLERKTPAEARVQLGLVY